MNQHVSSKEIIVTMFAVDASRKLCWQKPESFKDTEVQWLLVYYCYQETGRVERDAFAASYIYSDCLQTVIVSPPQYGRGTG